MLRYTDHDAKHIKTKMPNIVSNNLYFSHLRGLVPLMFSNLIKSKKLLHEYVFYLNPDILDIFVLVLIDVLKQVHPFIQL